MLHKYLDMLQRAAESFSHFGETDASWMNYFQTVGYELFLIAAGILILVAIAALLFLPVFGVRGIVKKSNTLSIKYEQKVHEYDEFVYKYHTYAYGFECGYSSQVGKSFRDRYDKLVELCNKYHIQYPEKQKDYSYKDVLDMFPEMVGSYDLKDYNVQSGQLGDFADVPDCMKKMRKITTIKVTEIIVLLLFYAVFAVPFVLMFIR